MARCAILIFLLFCPGYVWAQAGTYLQYTTANGLGSNTIYDILQDSQGFIWVSGTNGVDRFDGTYFRHFSIEDGLPDNEVLWMFNDSYGRIWFFCFNGRIGYYQAGKFYNAYNDSVLARIRLQNLPYAFYEGKNKQLYIHVQKGKVLQLTIHGKISGLKYSNVPSELYWEDGNDRYRLYQNKVYKNDRVVQTIDIRKHSFYYNFYAKGNSFYFSGSNGICVFEQDRVVPLIKWKHGFSSLQRFSVDSRDKIFVFDKKYSITEWERKGEYFEPTDLYSGVANPSKILIDNQEGVWVSSMTQGLFYYPANKRNFRIGTEVQKWPGKLITEMALTRQGQIIAGFENGNIATFDKSLSLQHSLLLSGTDMYYPIRSILALDQKSQLVVSGSSTYIFDVSGEPVLKRKIIGFKDIEAEREHIYFTSMMRLGYFDPMSGKVAYLDTGSHISKVTRKYAVLPYTGSDTIWFSDIEGLHVLYEGRQINLSGKHSFFKNRIIDIKKIGDQLLVLITDGKGIALINRNADVLQMIPGKELHSGLIRKASVSGGTLSLAGTSGIGMFTLDGNRLKPGYWMDENNGLLSNDVYTFCSDTSYLYVSSSKGLQKLTLSALTEKTATPELFIDAVSTGTKRWKYTGTVLRLPKDCEEITLHCSALSFGNSSKVSFAYRFDGSSRYLESQQPIFSIPIEFEGKRVLYIKCRKGNSDWSKEIILNLDIPIPFYRQIWFLVISSFLVVLSAVLISLYFAHLRKKRQLRVHSLRLQVLASEMRALQSMMNPHFMFNALNSIQFFINEGDVYRVNKYLTKFSSLIRANLDNNFESLIPVEKEISYIRNYLDLEQLRFGQKLNYAIEIDRSVDPEHMLIPGMLIQPLVENAILHGILAMEGPGFVRVALSCTASLLSIRVSDNGVGLGRSTNPPEIDRHKSMGLRLIRNRLSLLSEMHREHYHFQLISNDDLDGGSGATALLELPIIKGD